MCSPSEGEGVYPSSRRGEYTCIIVEILAPVVDEVVRDSVILV